MKRSGFAGSTDAHQECWELLPWLANERAAAKDVTRVQEHLRDCRECQDELELQRRLRDAIRTADAVVLAPQTSLQKLMQRIDAGLPHSEPTAVRSPPRRAHIRWSRWLPIAAGVQGIVIAALIGTLWLESRAKVTAPRFTTLTSHAVLARGPVIRVVFADGVALDEVKEILHSIDAQIVAGPSEAGVYTLGLSSSTGRVESALAQLRADRRIVFSESALARGELP
jgi:anti-sigma factor RsiW